MIEISQINKSFDGKNQIIDNLTLTIPDGKIVGFLGPNGAGKSTTINMMTGILPIDKGTITLNDIDIDKEPLKAKKFSDLFLTVQISF